MIMKCLINYNIWLISNQTFLKRFFTIYSQRKNETSDNQSQNNINNINLVRIRTWTEDFKDVRAIFTSQDYLNSMIFSDWQAINWINYLTVKCHEKQWTNENETV
jgi:hypothetical protein